MRQFPSGLQDLTTHLLCACRATVIILIIAIVSNSPTFITRSQQQLAGNKDVQRQQALLALEEIYTESKSYDDLALRVRVKAQLADVLWAVKLERASDLLSSAFDDATALKDDPVKRRSLRMEILRVAARHNRELVKKLIARYDTIKNNETDQPPPRDSFDRGNERSGLLLDSANTLLTADDQQGAISLARHSLSEGRSQRFLWFLSQLMEKDQAAGEKLFLDALNVLRQGPPDPNDALFYGMWMFYPSSMAIGTLGPRDSGVEVYSYGMNFSAARPRHPELLRSYLETSIDVLMRFQPLPNQPDSIKAIELKRFALKQLLPVIEANLPERAEAVRAELKSLGVAPSWAVDPKEAAGINPHPRYPDDISTNDMIADIRKTPDGLERDDIYFKESLRAYNRKDFDRARALASEVVKSDSKETLMTIILYNRAQKEIEQGDLDEAEKTATSQFDRMRKAEVYAQLSKAWAERGDSVRANEFMAWASSEAAKVDPRGKRAQVYIYLAGMCIERDATKAFEFIEAAVGDINAAEKFDLNSSTLLLDLQSPKGSRSTLGFARSISLISVIPQLAKSDLSRMLNAARSLTVPEPRALAVIAACREALAAKPNEKTEPPATKKPDKPRPVKKGKENNG